MKKICIVLLILLTANIFAQTSVFSNTYISPSGSVKAYCIIQAVDKGLVVAGDYQSNSLITKVDSTGNVLWSKQYLIASQFSSLKNICSTSDSCYVVVGTYTQNTICMKVKKNGDVVWAKAIPSLWGTTESVLQTKDKGFIITSTEGLATVTKLDSIGNFQWKQRINSANHQNDAITAKQLPDSSYAVLVYREVNNNSVFMSHSTIINLSKTGNLIWARSYNKSTEIFNSGMDMEVVNDGIVIFMSINSSPSPLALLKTDFSGNVIWCKSYSGGANASNGDRRRLIRTRDKGFVFGINGIMKTDSIGMPLWSTTFFSPQPHTPLDVTETKNKRIASVYHFYGGNWTNQIHINTLDSLGNGAVCTQSVAPSVYFENWVATSITPTLTSGGSAVSVSVSVFPISMNGQAGCPTTYPWHLNEEGKGEKIEISPNPSNGIFSLRTYVNCSFIISDFTGKLICKGNCKSETLIDISNETNGIYILQIKDESGKTLDSRKLIKK
ncbi:MAG: T9SS type A sorting domain-containing protein [Bacteroidia bacterium]|nr:T9SS type A sorting domain-containing protein [Bacteroidia bacterium]